MSEGLGRAWPEESDAVGSSGQSALPPPKRRQRWGLRTLGALALAIFAMAIAGVQGHHTAGTLGCTVLGIGFAVYCSIRGIRDVRSLEWYHRRLAGRSTETL